MALTLITLYGFGVVLCVWFVDGKYKIINSNHSDDVINVLPCLGKNAYELTVFLAEELTWPEAQFSCLTRGNNKGIFSQPVDYMKWTTVGHELLSSNVNGNDANMTFWHGTFRPFPNTDAWYFYDATSGTCTQTDGPGIFSQSSQCAVASWPNLAASLQPEVLAEDCNTRLPYICHNYESLVHLNIFVDYRYIPSADLIGLSQQTNFTAQTLENCLEQCSEISKCVSVEFNETGAICTHNVIERTDGSVSYNITRMPVSSGIIHGIKSGCSVTVVTAPPNVNVLSNTRDVPTCGLSSIPDDCCTCDADVVPTEGTIPYDPTDDMAAVIEAIVRNLTVPAKSTTKYQQRLVSRPDGRRSSAIYGVTAGVVIAVSVALFVVSDVVNVFWGQGQSFPRKRKRRSSRGNSITTAACGTQRPPSQRRDTETTLRLENLELREIE
ncbi:uncharacterized protein LOC127856835 [Dreissena polymorpha]|uniref:Apple domain-containing protein n=1 Tax=Dreissena polymorpha TaxID=45954 RepID=A0A9D3Z979_DREPO|nr:uncharacterized protein LOC127856835 [Dreissena polymorpha]KAH3712662.1 hypothetical protein DPMN_072415 [Dreissena polymorpha]